MQTVRHDITILTGAAGTATELTDVINGRVLSIHYAKATSSPLAATAVIAIVGEVTGQTVLNIAATGSVHRITRQTVQTASGVATATTWREPFFIANERLKLTVAATAPAKVGTVYIITG